MSQGSSTGFTSFFKSSAEKLSFKKGVKSVPPQTKSKDGDATDPKTKSQKEHRRAQVRKAQIEHRQRKENYVKHLEQDVNRLRDQVATIVAEVVAIKQENTSIKTTLSRSNISTQTVPFTNLELPEQTTSPLQFNCPQQLTPQGAPQSNIDLRSPQHSNWTSNSSSSDVSILFDEFIDTSCLQVSPHGSFEHSFAPNSANVFDFSANTVSQLSQDKTGINDERQQRPPSQLPNQDTIPSSTALLQLDPSSIAINFILALEHPCRTHFHASPTSFDPTGDPTGHQLLASALLYSHAPESVFSNLDSATWTTPSLELTQLWEMSTSLPKGDFEITPVQAWFLLSGKYEAGRLLGKVHDLKRRVGKLVACWAFGAVIDEREFWDVVNDIMGE